MWASDMALQKSEESMINLDREPRRHLNADFKIEKEKRQRMKLYCTDVGTSQNVRVPTA